MRIRNELQLSARCDSASGANMDEGTEDSAVQDFLQILEEHRKNCERQGKYVEAEIAKNRLEELKLHEENRRKEAMRSRQIAERLGVEEAHMLEFQQFNIVWDKKMAQYEQHADELVEAMQVRCAPSPPTRAPPCTALPPHRTTDPPPPSPHRFTQERHQGELREFQRKLLGKQQKPKFSRELLNLRKIQEHLAKQKDYTEAHKMKLKSDALEAWELEKWRNLKQQEMFQKEAKFKHRQQQELLALQKRIQTGREEQKKQRQMDLERCVATSCLIPPPRSTPAHANRRLHPCSPLPRLPLQPAAALPERQVGARGAAEPGAHPG